MSIGDFPALLADLPSLASLLSDIASRIRALLTGWSGRLSTIGRPWLVALATASAVGNAVATLLVGTWTREVDTDQVERVLGGRSPFDESTMSADGHGDAAHAAATGAGAEEAAAEATGSARDDRISTDTVRTIVGGDERVSRR